ncbi:MAG: NUMOD4 domain-containing protein [Xenococcaceae cyanobacterium]
MTIELWKDVPSYEGIYLVSNLGDVRSLDRETINSIGASRKQRGKKLTPFKNSTGYFYVTLSDGDRRSNRRVHSLVATAFLPNPYNKRTINHINGDKSDNRLCNLEWATDSENHTHAFKTGLKELCGIAKRSRKLTNVHVLEIRKLIEQGELTQKQIGEMFNVCRTTISDIKLGKRFKDVA